MKKIIVMIAVVICIPIFLSYADVNEHSRNRRWLVDSYNYGKDGRNCSDIYYNYGTDKWTFNSDDPALLKKLYETCQAGEEDKISGRNSLPKLLDAFNKQK
ncbi:MAG: hypothetical protein C4581_05750 [Nitrospiraceae bacterium]|nr:MAG: hypothetical protein C4581_05750 [Nitrospiraceae bacterium]